jgi:hypothetical protein
MDLLQRITSPMQALLLDSRDVPQWRSAVVAIVASLFAHLLLLLIFAIALGWLPSVGIDFAKAKAEPQGLEMTIVSLPASEPEMLTPEQLKARAERPNIDSTGLAKSEEAPKEAIFESDQNMKAASDKPPTGDAPLPSQEGRDLPFMNFKDQDVRLGSTKAPPSPSAPPVPTKPLFQPKPVAPDQTNPAKSIPEPATALATPPPVPQVAKASDREIAIAEKAQPAPPKLRTRALPGNVQPRALPESAPVPPKTQPMEMAKLTTPALRVPVESGFQEQQTKTRVDGAISNRGKIAVDAVRTPLSTYRRQVKTAIASRWYFYVKNHPDRFTLGSARFSYSITAGGKIVSLKLLENTSNDAFAIMCERCVREAEIGPPPEEAQAAMVQGLLADEATFILY